MVWNLYVAYEEAIAKRGIFDWEDVVLEAESSLAETPLRGYAAVDRRRGAGPVVRHDPDAALGSSATPRTDSTWSATASRRSTRAASTLAEAGVAIQRSRRGARHRNYRNTVEIAAFAAAPGRRATRSPTSRAGPARSEPAEITAPRTATGVHRVPVALGARQVARRAGSPHRRRVRRRDQPRRHRRARPLLLARDARRPRRWPRPASRPSSSRSTTGTPSTRSRSARSSAPRASSSRRCWWCALPRTWCRPTSTRAPTTRPLERRDSAAPRTLRRDDPRPRRTLGGRGLTDRRAGHRAPSITR